MKLTPITAESPSPEEFSIDDSIIRDVIDGTRKLYIATTFQEPWIGYLAQKNGEWVGTCAFKGVPINNKVEIAYFTFPKFEARGIATEMAEMLIKVAHHESDTITITAQTMPELNASTRILEKLGFRRTRELNHSEDGLVWEWEKNEAEQAGAYNP